MSDVIPATGTTTATTTAQTTGSAQATPPSWTASFNDDMKGFVSTKGFQGPDAVVDAYRNLEKMMGAPPERIIKTPEKLRADDGKMTPEARQIFERLGAPKEAKDYQIEIPKEFGDQAYADLIRSAFFEEGVTKAAADRIVKANNDYQAKQLQTMKEQAELAFKNQDQSLRKEWGAAYDQNVNIAKEAIRTLGIGEKEISAMANALGHDKAMQFFQKMGASVGEGKFISGASANQVVDPAQAKYQIKELMKDTDFSRRLMANETEARAKWDRLHQMANPGEFNING